MSKTLLAMLLPFLNMQFNVVEEGGGAETSAPESEQAKPEEQAPVTEQAEEKTETPSEETQAEKTFTQAELDAIVQKRLAKETRKLERQLDQIRIEQEVRSSIKQEAPAPTESAPKVEDFADYNEFLRATARWEVKQELQTLAKQEAEKSLLESQKSEAQRTQERQQALIDKGELKYDDFEDVVKSDKNTYSQAAYLAILESEQAADLVYHLAKNPEEGARIASLPAYAQAKEIGKLEDKLSAKPAKKISNAPEPIKPVTTGKADDGQLADNLSIDEWMKRRNKEARR